MTTNGNNDTAIIGNEIPDMATNGHIWAYPNDVYY